MCLKSCTTNSHCLSCLTSSMSGAFLQFDSVISVQNTLHICSAEIPSVDRLILVWLGVLFGFHSRVHFKMAPINVAFVVKL